MRSTKIKNLTGSSHLSFITCSGEHFLYKKVVLEVIIIYQKLVFFFYVPAVVVVLVCNRRRTAEKLASVLRKVCCKSEPKKNAYD